jgi:hypothetical protein
VLRDTNFGLLYIVQTFSGVHPTSFPTPTALSQEVKGSKGVLLNSHHNYMPRPKNVDVDIRVPNTSFVASCLTQTLSTGAALTLYRILFQNQCAILWEITPEAMSSKRCYYNRSLLTVQLEQSVASVPNTAIRV